MHPLRLAYEYLTFNISQTQGIHMLILRLRYGKRILVRSVRISLLECLNYFIVYCELTIS